MAIKAKTHRHVHGSHRHGSLPHIAVAGFAAYSGADMRSVVEFYMRRRAVIVNSLPGNVFSPLLVSGKFLDFRLVGGDDLMTRHAKVDSGDASLGAQIHSHVANLALQAVRQMDFMCEGNGLDGLRMPVEKIHHRVTKCPVCWSEYG